LGCAAGGPQENFRAGAGRTRAEIQRPEEHRPLRAQRTRAHQQRAPAPRGVRICAKVTCSRSSPLAEARGYTFRKSKAHPRESRGRKASGLRLHRARTAGPPPGSRPSPWCRSTPRKRLRCTGTQRATAGSRVGAVSLTVCKPSSCM
jgi:hypothetical protein